MKIQHKIFDDFKVMICERTNRNSIYNALFTFLWMCMWRIPFVTALLVSLCTFFEKKLFRLVLPSVIVGITIPYLTKDIVLGIYFFVMYAIGMWLMERRYRSRETRNDSNSLVILLLSMATLSILDFTQGVVLKGFVRTYGFGNFPSCLYRVFSVFLIAEMIRVLNAVFKSTKVSCVIGSCFFFLLGAVNYWVLAITNKEFLFTDLYLIRTVAGVVSNVQIQKEALLQFLLYVLFIVLFYLVLWKIKWTVFSRKERLQNGLFGLISILVMVFLIQSGFFRSYTYNGAMNMGLPVRLIQSAKGTEKPSGYDVFLKEMEVEAKEIEETVPTEKEGPNIIVIMSEAFSDLGLVGEFETNEDYMPFLRSVIQEYPSGILYSSAFGNKTASSEYEFLTGVSTGLTEQGGTIYQRYIEEEEESIVSVLQSQGYYAVGIHPYIATGYNRLHAWTSFGFEETYFDDAFEDANYVREYVSDASFYDKVIESYENKPKRPWFCFGISMQNHATYLTDYEGDIRLTDMEYDGVEEYLSLLKETDMATKEFLSYFENVDEDTMIVFFGDHQPMVEKDFYSEVLGTDYFELSLEQKKETYKIPYFVWTNYEADFDVPEEMSINYLPNVVLESAGLSKDSWFAFTDELFKEFPIITDNFVKVDGKYVAKEDVIDRLNHIKKPDAEHEWDLLKRYQVLSFQRALEK